MPDRYDPKLSVRPAGDRKNSDTRSGQGPDNEDPLVELARIVSGGRPSFEGGGARFEKPSTPAAPHPPGPSEADLARDLEAELLNELQASFSTIPEIVAQPRPQPPQPAPAAAQPKAPTLPPILPPLTFEVPGALQAPPEAPPPTPLMEAVINMPGSQPRPEPPQIRQPQSPARRDLASRLSRTQSDNSEGPLPRPEPPVPQKVAPQAPRANAFRPPNTHRADPGPHFRPTLAPNPPSEPEEPPMPSRAMATRWDQPPDRRDPPPDLTRFAPSRTDTLRPALPDRRDPPLVRDAEPGLAGDAALPTVEEAYFDEVPGNETFEMVPGYGDEEPPYPEDEAAYESRRSRKGPLAIAALLTIAVIGGAAAVMLRSGGASGDAPPIITADESPTKVQPDNTGGTDSEGQAKLIYDRVDPGSDVAKSELMVPDDAPIADIPPIPEEGGGSDVSRVILGGGPGVDASGDGAQAAPAAPMDLSKQPEPDASGGTVSEPIGPKKVRTVVVRPDGTIVSSAAAPAEETAEPIPNVPPASETPPAPAADQNPLLAEEFGVEPVDKPVGTTRADAAPPPANNPAPGNAAAASIPDIPPSAPKATAVPAPQPRPAPQAKPPAVVASTGPATGPIDGQSVPTGSGGGFLVQVSSQRSQETALSTFRDLQRRYPGILGDRQPNIQRADLGGRGVYYRVRVGYATRDQAVKMCESLKTAGGDCILATR